MAQPVVAVDEVAQRLLVLEQLPEHLAERSDQAHCPGTDQRALGPGAQEHAFTFCVPLGLVGVQEGRRDPPPDVGAQMANLGPRRSAPAAGRCLAASRGWPAQRLNSGAGVRLGLGVAADVDVADTGGGGGDDVDGDGVGDHDDDGDGEGGVGDGLGVGAAHFTQNTLCLAEPCSPVKFQKSL